MPKNETVTFKVDQALADLLKGIPNRSEFLRSAVLLALQNICPVCGGNGVLTAQQQAHWNIFRANHPMVDCSECQTRHLSCVAVVESSETSPHVRRAASKSHIPSRGHK